MMLSEARHSSERERKDHNARNQTREQEMDEARQWLAPMETIDNEVLCLRSMTMQLLVEGDATSIQGLAILDPCPSPAMS